MSIKLIAIDLDGTLLNDYKEIPQENIDAIEQASKMGVHVVLCTGRPLTGIQKILKQLTLHNQNEYVITYNGGLVQTTKGKTLIEHTLNFDDYLRAEAFSRKVGVHFHVDGKNHLYTANKNISKYTLTESLMVDMNLRYRAVSEMNPKLTIPKVMFIDYPDILAKARNQIFSEFQDNFEIVQSEPFFIEMLPNNVNKGNAVTELSQRLGLSLDEVMTIGDQGNDLSMIKAAKYGIAMQNAIDSVKSAAFYTTKTNNEAGVGLAIKKFVLDESNQNTN